MSSKLHIAPILPAYETLRGTISGLYEANYGNSAVSILATGKREFETYLTALTDAGAVLYTENRISNNRFLTYLLKADDGVEYTVTAIFYPILCNVRLIFGKRAFLPKRDKEVFASGTGRTSVLQFARDCVYNGNRGETVNGAPGMGYLITLSDGTFILIDGGPRGGKVTKKRFENGQWINEEPKDPHDCDRLYELLNARTPAGQKPVIAAWFFTHAHSDHTDLACDFLEKYKDAVEVRIGAYNFPDFEKYPTEKEPVDGMLVRMHLVADRLAAVGATPWNFHSGEIMSFPGCDVEILATHEDYYPCHFTWGNHTSSAFRMKFAGKTFMVLGDCEKDICQWMADKYGSELKSDILQLSHHGVNGACSSLYALIDPEHCFWAMDEFRFMTDARTLGTLRRYEFNAWIRDEDVRVRKHYHSSVDTEIFTDIP